MKYAVMDGLTTIKVCESERHAGYWARNSGYVDKDEFGPGQLKRGISIIELPLDDPRPVERFSMKEAHHNDGMGLVIFLVLIVGAVLLIGAHAENRPDSPATHIMGDEG